MTTNFVLLQTPGAGSGWETILMILALFAIFYFLMIRPQQKKQKQIQKFRNEIQKGDRVVTAGGIFGVVRQIKPTTFIIEIDKEVKIEIDKNSIYPAPEINAPAEEKK